MLENHRFDDENDLEKLWRVAARFDAMNNRIVGTLSIAALLIIVYQVEVIAADQLGYQSPHAFFQAVPVNLKPLLTATLGPFLHQSAPLVIGNIGVLILAGAYIEYSYGEKELYIFYLAAGYIAAWVPLLFGSVGAVGASGVTYGLRAWMTVHALHAFLQTFTVNSNKKIPIHSRIGHLLPLWFGISGVSGIVRILFNGSVSGAGDVTHIVGAAIGLFWGVYYIIIAN